MTKLDREFLIAFSLLAAASIVTAFAWYNGVLHGHDTRPMPRLIPMQSVLKDTDTCCVWVNGVKACLPPAILRGTQ